MWTLSRESYTNAIQAATHHMQATFHSKAQLFDGKTDENYFLFGKTLKPPSFSEFFTELLTHSKRDFHFMFKKTYGILYERNSDVFTDFFKDLETYYESGNIDLEEALRKFFSHLYQRMFTVLNSQYTFDSRSVLNSTSPRSQVINLVVLTLAKIRPAAPLVVNHVTCLATLFARAAREAYLDYIISQTHVFIAHNTHTQFVNHPFHSLFELLESHVLHHRYLECVSKNMQKLQPFGDVPKKLTLQLRRSFVATRTFSQALTEGKKVLARIVKIQAKDECTEALTKMTSCPACQGLPAIQPCTSFCLNVMKGCLAHHTELNDSWDKFVDSLTAVGERLIGPFNIEAVVEPIDIKISDAIMNFQESGYEVTQKVFQDCGQPRLGRRQASSGGFGYSVPQLRTTTKAGTNLDSLVTDIMVKVKDTKGFWTKLPSILCQNPDVGSGKDPVEQNCWNGRDRGYYSNKVNFHDSSLNNSTDI